MSSFIGSARDYLYSRRRGFAVLGGIVGGAYMLGQYAVSKLQALQQKLVEERTAKENLRRRFAQNQEDCTFTVLALLPTLGDQLFQEMDVEGLTQALQKTRAAPPPRDIPSAPTPPLLDVSQTDSKSSSMELEAPAPAETAASAELNAHAEKAVSAEQSEQKGPDGPTNGPTNGSDYIAEPAEVIAPAEPNGTAPAEQAEASAPASQPDQAETAEPASKAESADPASKASSEPRAPSPSSKSSFNPKARPFVPGGAAAAPSPPNGSAPTTSHAPEPTADADAGSSSADVAMAKVQAALDDNSRSGAQVDEAGAMITEEGHSEAAVLPNREIVLPNAQKEETRTEDAVDTTAQEPQSGADGQKALGGGPADGLNGIAEPAPIPTPEGASLPPSEPARTPVSAPAEADALAERKTKIELWNELKIVAFSRTLTALYSVVLLTLQTHIQLNLIGRFAYLYSVESLARPAPASHHINLDNHDPLGLGPNGGLDGPEWAGEKDDERKAQGEGEGIEGLSHETERKYLTFSWWFLHRGWAQIAGKVKGAVEEVFGGVPLKSQITYQEFSELLTEVRKRVEYEPIPDSFEADGTLKMRRSNFLTSLFPTSPAEERDVLVQAGAIPSSSSVSGSMSGSSPAVPSSSALPSSSTSVANADAAAAAAAPAHAPHEDAQLRALLDETKDFIDSPDFASVLRLCLDRVFVVFEHTMEPAFGIRPSTPSPPASNSAGGALGHGGLGMEQEPDLVPRFQELRMDEQEGKRLRLASLFPAVARQGQLAVHGVPNEYVDSLAEVKELRALSAIIYSSWSVQ